MLFSSMAYASQGLLTHDSFFSVMPDPSNSQLYNIYFGIQPLFSVSLENQDEFRTTIVHLVKMGVSVNRLSTIFNIHRNTINSWIAICSKNGTAALSGIKPGKTKITPDVQAYIIAKFKEIGFCRNYKFYRLLVQR